MAEDDKPPPKIGDHSVIRHAYSNAVTACARLHSFATGKRPGVLTHIAKKQEIIAQDDLILFAIHVRRLIENTVGKQHANAVKLKVASRDRKLGHISFWRAVNVIIHHKIVLRSRLKKGTDGYTNDLERALASVTDGELETLRTACVVESDNDKLLGFLIEDLADVFETIMEAIVDLCADHRLELADERDC